MSLTSTAATPGSSALLSGKPPARAAAPGGDDLFGAAMKQAERPRQQVRRAEQPQGRPADEASPAPQAPPPPADSWLAAMAAMLHHAQPPAAPLAMPAVDAAFQTGEPGDEGSALSALTDPPDPALAPASTGDGAAVDQFASLLASFPTRRAAGITSPPADAALAASAAPAAALAPPAPGLPGNPAAAAAVAPDAMAALLAVDAAGVPAPAAAADPAGAAPLPDPSAVPELAAPTPTHNLTQTPHAALARAELPSLPGPPTPLHGAALQGRLDEALRWMAGNGMQAAEVQVDPGSLGPITVQLRLQGDVANVVFSSAHEATRQALESSLAGLRDALASNGLSLGQASVGSEQQRNLFADLQGDGGRQREPAAPTDESGAAPASPGVAAGPRTTAAPRVGQGLVNIYA